MHNQETGDDAIPPKRAGDESPSIANQKQQQEYEAAYREQQQRRSCPGCGEEPFL